MSRRCIHWMGLVAAVVVTFVLGIAGMHRAAAEELIFGCTWESIEDGGWQLIEYNCGRAGCSSPGYSADPGTIMYTSCNGTP